jgi:phosphoglycolate phosphatase
VAARAVLFDLDGTLLDTLADIGESMNAALLELGLPTHPLNSYKRFVGDGVTVLVRRALPPEHRDDPMIASCAALMKRIYTARAVVKTRAYPGVFELVRALRTRGLALAVLSNKPHDLTGIVIDHYFGSDSFDAVLGASPDLPRKPDPTAALAIADRLGVPPGGFLYVGDTDTDMRTAVAAGMYPVGAAWGFRPVAELTASGACFIAREPGDVLRILDRIPKHGAPKDL